MSLNISSIDLIILFIYFLAIFSFGLWWVKKENSLDDYFLGSHSIPWWAASLSVMATECSALTFVGAPGVSYNSNMLYLQLAIGSFIGRVLSAKIFLKYFYDLKVTSIYEYLKIRFGNKTKNVGSLIFFITRILASGVRLYAASIAVSLATGFSLQGAIVLVAIFVMSYTIMGGIRSVIWTDVVQIIIFMGGAWLALAWIINEIPGGFSTFIRVAGDAQKFRIFDLTWNLSSAFNIWAGIIAGTFITFATHGSDQDLVQRLLTCKNKKEGVRALIWTGIIDFPVVITFMMIGIALYVYYQFIPDPTLPAKADHIFAHTIINHMPVGLVGIMLAGVFAAAMSSMDSALNALGATVVVDFYKPYIKPLASPKHYVSASRVCSVLVGILLIGVAFWAMGTTHVLILGLSILSFNYGALLGIFLLGMLTHRGHDLGNILAMSTGIVIVFCVSKFTNIAWPWYIFVGTLTTFGVGFLFSKSSN